MTNYLRPIAAVVWLILGVNVILKGFILANREPTWLSLNLFILTILGTIVGVLWILP